MPMLSIICNDCGNKDSLRGWVEKQDLIGTKYEHMIDSITEEELYDLEIKGKVKDRWDKFVENPICPECGSKNVIWF